MAVVQYEFGSEVYKVNEKYEGEFEEDDDWYEYHVYLCLNGGIVDEWDSLFQCYNGMQNQRLTKDQAGAAVAEIEADIKAGNAKFWFALSR